MNPSYIIQNNCHLGGPSLGQTITDWKCMPTVKTIGNRRRNVKIILLGHFRKFKSSLIVNVKHPQEYRRLNIQFFWCLST